MLNAIVSFSARHAGVVVGLGIALLVFGFYSLSNAKYDVFPEFLPPLANIQTEAPGLSPEQVEILVTQPIENAVNGIVGIATLRSTSIQGLSMVRMTFNPGEDIYRVRQMVAERLTGVASQLPRGVTAPAMTPLTSSTGDMLYIGLTSKTKSLMELRDKADWLLKPRLLAVPGVADVTVYGGDVRQLQIQLKPAQLLRYSLSVQDVREAAERATGVLGSGFIDSANQRIVLQADASSRTAEAIGNAVLLRGAGENIDLNIRLKDVADVREAAEPRVGAAGVMGEEGVILMVLAQYGANTMEVTRASEAALAELKPVLAAEGITLYPGLFRPANFIEVATRAIGFDLLLGAALVVAVLFAFLSHARTALISVTAIPLSLIAAVAVLQHFGFTLNTMTLGGLAIAIGAVVDDAVINVENILRRLRENQESTPKKSRFQVVTAASLEVQSAVVFATFAIALVFSPMLGLSGLAGRLFKPLGIAYIAAILASLLAALTVTPALCVLLLRDSEIKSYESRFAGWLKVRYAAVLANVSRASGGLSLLVGVLMAASLLCLPFFRGQFIPELQEGNFVMHVSTIPGTSLRQSLQNCDRISQALLKLPFVAAVSVHVGRAARADDVFGTHFSEMNVNLKPLSGEEAEQAQAEIGRTMAGFPGISFKVNTFLSDRVEDMVSGYGAQAVLNIYGLELDDIDGVAAKALPILQAMHGAANVQLQSPPGTPQLSIRLKPEALGYWGLEPADVLTALHIAYEGEKVSEVFHGNQIVDVSVLLSPSSRESVLQVGELPVRTPSGAMVKLSDLADIQMESGRYSVLRDGARRVQTITFDVSGAELAAFIAAADKEIHAKVQLPPGTYMVFTGTAEAERQAKRDMLLYGTLAGFGIIALLAIVTGSRNNLLLILLNLPFALAGGVLAVLMMGGALSLGALVGFVTLFGISLRNSVMMISHFEHLVHREGQAWSFETMLRGASERLIPILMTAIVTALGLLPLAVGSGDPGREIEGPMAIVILGGLLSSTLLNLCVLPGLAWRFAKFTTPEN
jgi:CzcA family heavy metal efflux pump